MTVGVTGSAGMQFAELLDLPFVQEVVAARTAIERRIPQVDAAIEIGGEDSKILFLTGGEELRMNSTCAGGTGGFIDTIAGMLDMNAEALNYCAHGCRTVHAIASRCAVFAQMDVRPLLNEGVPKEDIAGSVFDAVAAQCIAGLACGRPIRGPLPCWEGRCTSCRPCASGSSCAWGLDDAHLVVPPDAHLFVAEGSAFEAWDEAPFALGGLIERLESVPWDQGATLERLPALFSTDAEYEAFVQRHAALAAPRADLSSAEGRVFLGVDSGSEAIKYVLADEQGRVLRTYYERSAGSVVEAAQAMLVDLWKHLPLRHDGTPAVEVAHACVTGYGEELLKKAFALDSGEVETVAHVRAARELVPDADFILDIGGQDIKCVWLRDGAVDDIVLNEACSSGCGALLSGMAWSMNVRFDRFLEAAVHAQRPVDLGTRCTVFMTSRVRHAQKEGAELGDIAAGLAYSVVRNAVYKVIRARDATSLGRRVVVQGGTFMNDAVLRAFENLYGAEVARPALAAHMGAYGAALIARDRAAEGGRSGLLSRAKVERLASGKRTEVCGRCGNACRLTVTTFDDGDAVRTFTVGNRCERALGDGAADDGLPDLFAYRLGRVFAYRSLPEDAAPRGTIGLPRALGLYDLYPFWHTLLTCLGFRVVPSSLPAAALRGRALETIPSESLCYPAKLTHAHLVDLAERGVSMAFLPYVAAEGMGGRSCPVLAGYPFVLDANVGFVHERGMRLVMPQVEAVLGEDGPDGCLVGALQEALEPVARGLGLAEVECAAHKAAREQARFREDMRAAGRAALAFMAERGVPGVVLAGRPYHGDPAVNHAIPGLLRSYGFAVLTEDALPAEEGEGTAGLGGTAGEEVGAVAGRSASRWEYPARILQAARFAAGRNDVEFVMLYSFGCGLDAVTVDQVRAVLKERGSALTALKIDEMVDLAATRIRVRSMVAAREERLARGGAR
ncbi:MAG: acyl-CoA dehydratase activase-related protein [Gordonibacter pamelaeae]